jgi:hypothetical protein
MKSILSILLIVGMFGCKPTQKANTGFFNDEVTESGPTEKMPGIGWYTIPIIDSSEITGIDTSDLPFRSSYFIACAVDHGDSPCTGFIYSGDIGEASKNDRMFFLPIIDSVGLSPWYFTISDSSFNDVLYIDTEGKMTITDSLAAIKQLLIAVGYKGKTIK